MQNIAAKLILGGSKFSSSSGALKTLHWVPIKYRIPFKIAVLVFKCLCGTAPKYLNDLLVVQLLVTVRSTILLPVSSNFQSSPSFAHSARHTKYCNKLEMWEVYLTKLDIDSFIGFFFQTKDLKRFYGALLQNHFELKGWVVLGPTKLKL